MKELTEPIVILGAARSGTTLMVRMLQQHPDVACWNEPSFIWRYGHAFRKHDVIRREEATPKVKRYVRAQFQAFLEQSQGTRFMEKTPPNCFRVPFVLEVLPDAQIVHIIRDGRDVAISAADMWSGGAVKPVMAQRKAASSGKVVGGGTAPEPKAGWRSIAWIWGMFRRKAGFSKWHIRDWYSFLAFLEKSSLAIPHFRRHLFHDSRLPWGPRFPGIRQVRRAYSLLQTCAIQWDLSVRMARSACLGLPADRYLEVRYEALIADPETEVERILAFLGLPFDAALLAQLTADIGRREVSTWPTMLTDSEVRDIEEVAADTLVELGYPLMADLHRRDRPALAVREA